MEGLAICKLLCIRNDFQSISVPLTILLCLPKEVPADDEDDESDEDFEEMEEEDVPLDETGYDAADELARLEQEAMEAEYATPRGEDDNADTEMDKTIGGVKRSLDETIV